MFMALYDLNGFTDTSTSVGRLDHAVADLVKGSR
jgi:hypothetical protein